MTIPGDIIIPALTFRTAGGDLDEATTARYAATAAGTWLDYFILSGTTTEGDSFTVEERAQVLDIWLNTTDKSRLVACCWTRDDIDTALQRGIRPMAVMRGLRTDDEAIEFFRTLPPGAFAYSNPSLTATVLHPGLIDQAKRAGCLAAGAKISKVSISDIAAVASAAGRSFTTWDGSCRRIGESLAAGATGVVATPLCGLPKPFPPYDVDELQSFLAPRQGDLDRFERIVDRANWHRKLAKRSAKI